MTYKQYVENALWMFTEKQGVEVVIGTMSNNVLKSILENWNLSQIYIDFSLLIEFPNDRITIISNDFLEKLPNVCIYPKLNEYLWFPTTQK